MNIKEKVTNQVLFKAQFHAGEPGRSLDDSAQVLYCHWRNSDAVRLCHLVEEWIMHGMIGEINAQGHHNNNSVLWLRRGGYQLVNKLLTFPVTGCLGKQLLKLIDKEDYPPARLPGYL